ncbi:hypothetical protein A6A27_19760 [Micromonospora sp. CB01531]|nr:hypothetical protein A6A27_19760 [Micromonospora sp. CB01531]
MPWWLRQWPVLQDTWLDLPSCHRLITTDLGVVTVDFISRMMLLVRPASAGRLLFEESHVRSAIPGRGRTLAAQADRGAVLRRSGPCVTF